MANRDLSALRDRPTLARVASHHGVELTLKGANSWGRCPFHLEKTPSFVIYDDGHFHCYGCGAHGDAIAFVMRISGWNFKQAIEHLSQEPSPTPTPCPAKGAGALPGTGCFAQAIWQAAARVIGTPGEAYLRRCRGIEIPIPRSIRFAPLLEHRPCRTKTPALVIAIQAIDGKVVAIQRIYLQPDGLGKAFVEPSKMTLGPAKGAALRLAAAQSRLGLAEGLETGLSVMQLTGTPVWVTCGGANLMAVELPNEVTEVVIYGDNGERGHAFVDRAARRFHLQGRKVRVAFPTPEFGDFNDLLLGQSAKEARAA